MASSSRDIKIKTLGKKCSMGTKIVFLEQEMQYYMVHIAHYKKFANLQICNYMPKQRICRENSKYALDENFMAIFALAEMLPTSATLM